MLLTSPSKISIASGFDNLRQINLNYKSKSKQIYGKKLLFHDFLDTQYLEIKNIENYEDCFTSFYV
ncbi:hypothetical protein D1614_15205 [Maribellus luteus]|uniref:Uncharacterized protein n=1 Tax=Maribellus luteus TaxID=2305463 RepID=A0A399SXS4_9BACT|nr:hypothetical protein D1614_15205 [Maribellus luteus]